MLQPLITSFNESLYIQLIVENFICLLRRDRTTGQKIDIIWSMKPTDLEFSICEVSGPPNKRDHMHFFKDKIKIGKMLKVIINRIVRKYGCRNAKLCSLKNLWFTVLL